MTGVSTVWRADETSYCKVFNHLLSKFLERSFLPQLLPFNGSNPRSVVLFDNASIHHESHAISRPYSPVLNSIDCIGWFEHAGYIYWYWLGRFFKSVIQCVWVQSFHLFSYYFLVSSSMNSSALSTFQSRSSCSDFSVVMYFVLSFSLVIHHSVQRFWQVSLLAILRRNNICMGLNLCQNYGLQCDLQTAV